VRKAKEYNKSSYKYWSNEIHAKSPYFDCPSHFEGKVTHRTRPSQSQKIEIIKIVGMGIFHVERTGMTANISAMHITSTTYRIKQNRYFDRRMR